MNGATPHLFEVAEKKERKEPVFKFIFKSDRFSSISIHIYSLSTKFSRKKSLHSIMKTILHYSYLCIYLVSSDFGKGIKPDLPMIPLQNIELESTWGLATIFKSSHVRVPTRPFTDAAARPGKKRQARNTRRHARETR